ncbi:MAG: hypothetical protein ACRC4I_15640 [Aeromonas veronii]
MDTKKIWLILDYIKWISIVVVFIYALHPLINGMGCDYHSQTEDEKQSIYTTCKFGIINAVGVNKKTKKTIQYSGVYGKSGNTIFFYTYERIVLNDEENTMMNIIAALNNSNFYMAYVFKGDGYDWIFIKYPYYNIYRSKRVGAMGFF